MEALERLKNILKEHTEIHTRLIELEEKKRVAIIENKIAELQEINELESSLVLAVKDIEERRIECSREVAGLLGINESSNMKAILEKLEGDIAEAMFAIYSELKEVIDALRMRTTKNAALLEYGLEHVNKFFETLNSARVVAPVYGKNGANNGMQVRMMDHTA
jgi:flagellar biosynthesis/type III secretory pathway chaperone